MSLIFFFFFFFFDKYICLMLQVSYPVFMMVTLVIMLLSQANEASQEILVVQLLCWDHHHLVQ